MILKRWKLRIKGYHIVTKIRNFLSKQEQRIKT